MSDVAQTRWDGTGVAVVSTTMTGSSEAATLARTLVEARLAACVQIFPVQSTYRWEGTIESAEEHLLLCKIRIADFEIVRDAILARHDYALPEVVMTPIVAGSAAYLSWLQDMTGR